MHPLIQKQVLFCWNGNFSKLTLTHGYTFMQQLFLYPTHTELNNNIFITRRTRSFHLPTFMLAASEVMLNEEENSALI